jgi:3-oxoacyl-[acyl-carrier-protein] synthase III
MLPMKIAGLGHYLPECVVSSAELESRLNLTNGFIEQSAGIRERRFASHETSAGMAAAASRQALQRAGLDAAALDLIVGASTSPQQSIPCTAALVQRELAAPDGRSACFDVNATCLSFLFALHTVAPLVAMGTYRNALIFSSEIICHSLDFSQPHSAVLFGEAAAAAVVTRADEIDQSVLHHAVFETHSSGADHTRVLGGGSLHHPNDPTTTTQMNMFDMNGRAVIQQAGRLIGPFVERALRQTGWSREEVDLLVPHQASKPALGLLVERLGFRSEQMFVNLPTRGNCVAASIPLAFSEALEQGRLRRGQRVMLLGSGAGLSLGAITLTF